MRTQFTIRRSLIGLATIGCLLSSAGGRTLYVSPAGSNDLVNYFPTWAGAATTIQAAVTIATNNDTVWVTNVTYNLTNQVALTNAVTVIGVNRAATVNGGRMTRGFYLSHTSAVLDGFIITNGSATNGNGGGVWVVSGTAQNCVIRGNVATNGGGVRMSGGVMRDCVISGNIASNYGGGVFMNNNSILMYCIVSSNSSFGILDTTYGGGGMYCSLGTVSHCTISDNSAALASGGGMFCGGDGSTVDGCVISGNSGPVGGVYVRDDVIVRNCLIVSNKTLYAVTTAITTPQFYNCTIVSNIWGFRIGKTCYFQNTIIYSNTVGNLSFHPDGTNATFTNCCTIPINGLPNVGTLHGAGNTTNAPQFADFSAGNYRLTGNSPCVNAGINQEWMTGAKDLGGYSRIDRFSGCVDIGAYEYCPPGILMIFR